MAAIYKKKRDEICVYHNRVPKKDGRNPILGWLIAAMILFSVRAFSMALIVISLVMTPPEIREVVWNVLMQQPFMLLLDVLVIIFLGTYICQQFTYLAFSKKKRMVYAGILFFRRKIASFDELGEVWETQQELKGKEITFFSILWSDDKFKKPLRISPKVKIVGRLSRYYHEIAPLLADLLQTEFKHAIGDVFDGEAAGENPESSDVEAVAVETVEVPDEDAESYISVPASARVPARRETDTESGSKASGETDEANEAPRAGAKRRSGSRKKKKYQYFTEKKPGVYEPKTSAAMLILLVLNIAFLAAFYYFYARHYWIATLVLIGSFVYSGRMILRAPFRTLLNPSEQTVTLITALGFSKIDLPVNRLVRITIKNIGVARQVCLVFRDQLVDPFIMENTSGKGTRACLKEFGEIMGFDAESYFNRR